jgi:hypothetical protein
MNPSSPSNAPQPARLFVLRHSKGGTVIGTDNTPLYFSSKPAAKAARDAIGGDTVVSIGPDHRLYKHTTTHTTKGQ